MFLPARSFTVECAYTHASRRLHYCSEYASGGKGAKIPQQPVTVVLARSLVDRLNKALHHAAHDAQALPIGGDSDYSHQWVKPPQEIQDFVYYIDLESVQVEG